ncbi:DUF456 domain-containing protein [Wenyingzhuangia sp. chi5]|uniref:DUF456 domain-containing protein n=1 Tax=Wenyingzhuangia gilva TaxID=3057677 RepID=A0ABT8VPN7_9FLAO|nr:DUF456 domain-containing protein [Wenyingzhuangia sp. chi5]MDO3693916.1 DUF456 domain-containing protein [Wenyingzhuangia sp. chi5]
MDYILLFFGFFLVIGGIIGSFLPIIPGPPTGWLGLLLLNLTSKVITDWTFLGVTLAIAILVVIADYIIPVLGTKKFGGSKYGIWGSTIGLIIGLLFTAVGMILGLFLGALAGELVHDSKNMQKAIKAALGSVIGFFFSTGIKLIVGIVFLVYFVRILIENKDAFF